MSLSSELVVLRPLAIGAAATTAGALIGTAPLPAGAGVLGYLGSAVLIRAGWNRSRPARRRFGAGNAVTLARLVASGWILALVLQAIATPTPAVAIAITVLGTVCLVLDGVDGRVARRRGEASSFGARFDVETDAATTLLLSIAIPIFDIAGWWVVAIGLLRYAYVVAALIIPALRRPLPFSQSRRVIGVVQAVLLLIALGAVATSPVPELAAWLPVLPALSLAMLIFSFGRDVVRHVLRH